MSSTSIIGAAVAIFIIAALLYYQSKPIEPFTQFPGPVAGRPYGAFNNADEHYPVPADLNRPAIAVPTSIIPSAPTRPTGVPGPGHAPKDATATRKDLADLDDKIMVWLDGASQRDAEQPGMLTSEQRQRRVMLQGRLADVRTQFGTGLITDSAHLVQQETLELRKENAGWRQLSPSLEAVYAFGKDSDPDAFLTDLQYAEFRGFFNTSLNELKKLAQPNPLQRVRLQQLQVIQQELLRIPKAPAIRVAAARLFLIQALKSEQPLPTLFSLESREPEPTLFANSPVDIINALRDIQWKLTVSYNPAEQELKRSVAAMLNRLQSESFTTQDIQAARQTVSAIQNQRAPQATAAESLAYNPDNLQKRAATLCRQIREAFPEDATALGCDLPVENEFEAESVINTVCDRLRYSVPSVTPEQFNCPSRKV
jgi:hypothetical protein